MKKMISIIIILKNDPGIINTLVSINDQNYRGDAEVLIIDRSTIKYPKLKMKYSTEWIRYPKTSKRYTIPEQRNMGISKAVGNIIVFIDASCVADKNWLSNLVLPIQNEKENVIMGRTGSVSGATLNDLKYTKLAKTKYSDQAPTINLAIRRDVFMRAGTFDQNFEYGSDMDFTWRLIDMGYKIYYAPTAFVAHDWGGYREELKRSILYGKARPRLYLKHYKTRLHYLIGQDSPALLYPLLIVGLPITLFYSWYPLIFLLLILKNLREPNPVGIVVKHIFYGWGVILELLHQVRKYVS